MKGKKNIYLVIAAIVMGIAIIYFLASYVVPRAMVLLNKATPASKVSISNSRVIGEQILAKADGKDKCIVSVFVLDVSDKGVPGRGVVLTGMENIFPQMAVTDGAGKASFTMTSAVEGQFEIAAGVDGVQLPKTVKVTFRND